MAEEIAVTWLGWNPAANNQNSNLEAVDREMTGLVRAS
jgi:hypothetical protein